METKSIRNMIKDEFPSIYVKDIDNALKINKNSYIATYYYLEDKIKLNQLKLKHEVNRKGISSTSELAKLVNPKVECSCCCDEKSIENFGHCTDGHLICKVCIKTHAENTIYQNLSCKIKCIDCNEKCMGTFTEETIQNIVDERTMIEYRNLKKLEEINELCVEDINIKLCQHCGAGTDIGETSGQELLVCMECFKDTCLKCNQIDHPGKECYSLGNINRGKRQMIEDKMTDALILKCNNCRTSLVKTEGCNKVTCVCGTHNCYMCKQLITKSVGYSHFCQKMDSVCGCNKCHLWTYSDNRVLESVKEETDEETKKLINSLL
jgi:TRIAD3 protein (E3 ubiquitin-protein ligase RNF216)